MDRGEGNIIRLNILKLENPGCIWAREARWQGMSSEAARFQSFVSKLNKDLNAYDTIHQRLSSPDHRQICVGKLSKDNQWYRLRVESQNRRSNHYTCFLLDEGVTETFSLDWLCEAPDNFHEVPFQAKKYSLGGISPLTKAIDADTNHGIRPTKFWIPAATALVNNLLKGDPYPEAQVLGRCSDGSIGIRLTVSVASRGSSSRKVCVNKLLTERELAQPIPVDDNPGMSLHDYRRSEVPSIQTAPMLTKPTVRKGAEMLGPPPLVSDSGGSDNDSGARRQPLQSAGRGLKLLKQMKGDQSPSQVVKCDEVLSSRPPVIHLRDARPGTVSEPAGRLQVFGLHGSEQSSQKKVHSPQGWGRGQKLLMAMATHQSVRPPSVSGQNQHQSGTTSSASRVTSQKAALPSTSQHQTVGQPTQNGARTGRGRGILAYNNLLTAAASPASRSTVPSPAKEQSIKNQFSHEQITVSVATRQDPVKHSQPAKARSIATNVIPLPDIDSINFSDSCLPAGTVTDLATQKEQMSTYHKNIIRGISARTPSQQPKSAHSYMTGPAREVIPIPDMGDIINPSVPERTNYQDVKQLTKLKDTSSLSLRNEASLFLQTASQVPPQRTPLAENVRQSVPLPEVLDDIRPSISLRAAAVVPGDDSSESGLESRPPRPTACHSQKQRETVSHLRELTSSDSQHALSASCTSKHETEKAAAKPSWPLSDTDTDKQSASSGIHEKNLFRDSSPANESSVIQPSGKREDHLELFFGDSETDNEDTAFNLITEQDELSSDLLGVLLDGGQPSFMRNTKMCFDTSVNAAIQRMELVPTNVQGFCWSAFLRGSHLVGVSSGYRPEPLQRGVSFTLQGGTTFAYLLPLVAQLKQDALYKDVPAGVGPVALVLCTSWRRVHRVYNQLGCILGKDISLRALELYGAGAEETQAVALVNGCHLVVATPSCLLRLINRSLIETKRLCHVILDDADNLLKTCSTEITDIMTRYKDALQDIGHRAAPQQIVAMATHWTPPLCNFVNEQMTSPTIVIASMAQSAIYCGVKKVVHVCEPAEKIDQLITYLKTSSSKKMIIFTSSPASAIRIHKILQNFHPYVLLCHEDLLPADQAAVCPQWATGQETGVSPVLVMTDAVLAERWQHDAEVVVHYDPPQRKEVFGPRMWCMSSNFKKPLSPSETSKDATSVLLVTKEWKEYIGLVMKDLESSSETVPPKLQDLADELLTAKDRGKYTELCHFFKAYGCCGLEHNCKARHSIDRELDTPGSQPFHQKLPTSGHVKVYVTSVQNASCLWVRLLEHEEKRKVTGLQSTFTELYFSLQKHYSNEANRHSCGTPAVGDFFVVKNNEDIYNRVRVLELKFKHYTKVILKVKVQLIDIGNVITVTPSELLVLDEEFTSIPQQAVQVYVCLVKPTDSDPEWTNVATDRVYDATYRQEMEGNIVLTLGNTLWLHPLVKRDVLKNVGTITHSVVIHRLLLNESFAEPNPQHLPLLYDACKGHIDLPEVLNLNEVPHMGYDMQGLPARVVTVNFPQSRDDLPSVEVTAVSHPGLFYVKLSENTKELEEMHEDIRDYIKVNMWNADIVHTPSVQLGSLVLAPFPNDNDHESPVWYRGKVMSIEDENFDVLYLDTGESELVNRNQVYLMPRIFTHWPYQAIECSLANVLPPNGEEWKEEDGDYLWLLVTGADNKPRPLTAEVISTASADMIGLTSYQLRLFDTNTEFDLDVAQELIVQNHARPTEDLLKMDISMVEPSVSGEYSKLPDLCIRLVVSQDQESQIAALEEIEKIVMDNQEEAEAMCECRAFGAICQVLGYLSNMQYLEKLAKCLVGLIKLNSSVFRALLKGDGITTICRILSRTDSNGHRVMTWMIAELVHQQQRMREPFIERGVLRLLASLLYCQEKEQPEIIRQALVALMEISQAVTEKHRSLVLRSNCIQALCHQLEESRDPENILHGLQALRVLLLNVRIQEESRRWATPVLQKMLTNVQKEDPDEPAPSEAAANRSLPESIEDAKGSIQTDLTASAPASEKPLCVSGSVLHDLEVSLRDSKSNNSDSQVALSNGISVPHDSSTAEYNRVICDMVDFDSIKYDKDILSATVLAMTALCRHSVINKEALLEYGVVEPLNKVVTQPEVLSDVAREEGQALLDALIKIRQSTELPHINNDIRHDIVDDVERTAAKHHNESSQKDTIRNIPLSQEELNTICQTMFPQVTWFQDRRNLILLVQVKGAREEDLRIEVTEDFVAFRAVVERIDYKLELPLYELIQPARCEWEIRPGQVRLGLRKVSKGTWPRVIKGKGKLPYLRPDFTRLMDESDDESDADSEARDEESPLAIMERSIPRPPTIPPPTAEHPDLLRSIPPCLPYDPEDDARFGGGEDGKEGGSGGIAGQSWAERRGFDTDERDDMDRDLAEHEEVDQDMRGNYFNL